MILFLLNTSRDKKFITSQGRHEEAECHKNVVKWTQGLMKRVYHKNRKSCLKTEILEIKLEQLNYSFFFFHRITCSLYYPSPSYPIPTPIFLSTIISLFPRVESLRGVFSLSDFFTLSFPHHPYCPLFYSLCSTYEHNHMTMVFL